MEWISVKDRLPELEVDVLVYNDKFKIFEVSRLFKHEYESYNLVDGSDGLFKKEKKISTLWSNNDVTHWQPLPEPPTQVKDL